jgi:site-specific DNA recombinase
MEKKKAVGIWLRVSTEDQARGESPEHHEQRAKLFAESMGWEIKTIYHLEGLSGKTVMEYPETKRMLQDIKSGYINGLIFSKLARLARNAKELLEMAEIFRKHDAGLISLQEAFDTNTPIGRMFYMLLAAFAQWEREEISDRIAASVPIRAKLGKSLGGVPPLGYKWSGVKGERREFVIDEEYGPTRKLIYELFLKFRRKKAVAKYLNDNGYRTPKNTKFSDTTIKQLIQDPTAKGVRRLNYSKRTAANKYIVKPVSEWVMHPCPAIVSEEVWDECNRILDEILIKNKKPGRIAKHLLAGFVHCETCDCKLYVFHQTKLPTYRCRKCGTRIAVTDIDEIFHGKLKEFLLTGVSLSEYHANVDSELILKENTFSKIQAKRDALAKKISLLIDIRLNNEISKEMFQEKHKPMEEQLRQLDTQLAELQSDMDFLKLQLNSSQAVLTDASDLYSQWHTYTLEDKRQIVETITDKITVGKQHIRIKLSYLPEKKPHPTEPNSNFLNSGKRQGTLISL